MFMFFLRPENRRSPAGSMLHPPCSHRGVHTCLTTVSLRLGTLPPPPFPVTLLHFCLHSDRPYRRAAFLRRMGDEGVQQIGWRGGW
jgi:hypothetical protein